MKIGLVLLATKVQPQLLLQKINYRKLEIDMKLERLEINQSLERKKMSSFKLVLDFIFQKQLRPPLMPMEITYKNAIYLKGFFVTFIAKSCHAL